MMGDCTMRLPGHDQYNESFISGMIPVESDSIFSFVDDIRQAFVDDVHRESSACRAQWGSGKHQDPDRVYLDPMYVGDRGRHNQLGFRFITEYEAWKI